MFVQHNYNSIEYNDNNEKKIKNIKNKFNNDNNKKIYLFRHKDHSGRLQLVYKILEMINIGENDTRWAKSVFRDHNVEQAVLNLLNINF